MKEEKRQEMTDTGFGKRPWLTGPPSDGFLGHLGEGILVAQALLPTG